MIKEIILNYIKALKELGRTDFEVVINKDWLEIDDDIEIIYCGDNPGKTEKEQKKYFVGNAGNELELFIKVHNKRLGKSKNTFFNKTPCHSIKTKDITKTKDLNKVVYTSIKLTIDCFAKIYEIKQIPIIVFGSDESSYIVKSFKEILNDEKYSTLKASLTILNHPSYNSLFATFGKCLISKFENKDEIHLTYSDLLNKTKKKWREKSEYKQLCN